MARKRKKRERIGEGLVRIGAMTMEQVKQVLEAKRRKYGHDKLFGEIAVELQFVDQETIERYLRSL